MWMASVANAKAYPRDMAMEVNGVLAQTLTILQVLSMTCFKSKSQMNMWHSEIALMVSQSSPKSLMRYLRWIMALAYVNGCVHGTVHSIIQLQMGSYGLLVEAQVFEHKQGENV